MKRVLQRINEAFHDLMDKNKDVLFIGEDVLDPYGGGGWCAEEALAIGVYAALVAESFSDGIRIAVNHSGDSDSTGSIAGQILGATLGIQAIGMEWLNDLELRDELNMLAHDFYSISNLQQGAQMPLSFREKYPPN